MSAARTAVATFQQQVASANLCEGLVTDKASHSLVQAAVSKPAAGQAFVDPNFRTTIRRVTDYSAIGKSYVKTMYSTQPAWSKDEKWLLLLASGYEHVLYDGKTYAFNRNISNEINPSDGEQVLWSQSNADELYYADRTTREFFKYNVVSKVKTRLHDFKTAPTSCTDDLTLGSDPMYGSWDGKKIGLTCQQKNWVYDMTTDRVYTVVNQKTQDNNPQTAYVVAPSGNKVFLSYLDSVFQVRDLDGNILRTVPNVTPHEHASLGKYANGDDAFFGVQFDAVEGSIVGVNLESGVVKVHVGPATGWPFPPSGTHVSALSIGNPGWVVASSVGGLSGGKLGQGVLENELVYANVDTGAVCRVGHHRSAADEGPNGYFAEPHPVPSPSGTRIAFSSDWFGTGGAEVYVVELPSYRP